MASGGVILLIAVCTWQSHSPFNYYPRIRSSTVVGFGEITQQHVSMRVYVNTRVIRVNGRDLFTDGCLKKQRGSVSGQKQCERHAENVLLTKTKPYLSVKEITPGLYRSHSQGTGREVIC